MFSVSDEQYSSSNSSRSSASSGSRSSSTHSSRNGGYSVRTFTYRAWRTMNAISITVLAPLSAIANLKVAAQVVYTPYPPLRDNGTTSATLPWSLILGYFLGPIALPQNRKRSISDDSIVKSIWLNLLGWEGYTHPGLQLLNLLFAATLLPALYQLAFLPFHLAKNTLKLATEVLPFALYSTFTQVHDAWLEVWNLPGLLPVIFLLPAVLLSIISAVFAAHARGAYFIGKAITSPFRAFTYNNVLLSLISLTISASTIYFGLSLALPVVAPIVMPVVTPLISNLSLWLMTNAINPMTVMLAAPVVYAKPLALIAASAIAVPFAALSLIALKNHLLQTMDEIEQNYRAPKDKVAEALERINDLLEYRTPQSPLKRTIGESMSTLHGDLRYSHDTIVKKIQESAKNTSTRELQADIKTLAEEQKKTNELLIQALARQQAPAPALPTTAANEAPINLSQNSAAMFTATAPTPAPITQSNHLRASR